MRRVVIVGLNRLITEGLARLLAESGFNVIESDRSGVSGEPPAQDESIDLVLTHVPASRHHTADDLRRIGFRYPRAKIILLSDSPGQPDIVTDALANGAAGYVDQDISFIAMHAVIDAVLHGQIVCSSTLRDGIAVGQAPTAELAGHAVAEVWSGRERRRAFARPDMAVVSDDMCPNPAVIHQASLPAQPERSGSSSDAGPLPDDTEMGGPEPSLSRREITILHLLVEGHANKVIARRLNISEATVKSHLKSLLRKLHFSNRTQAAIWAVNHYGLGAVRFAQQPQAAE